MMITIMLGDVNIYSQKLQVRKENSGWYKDGNLERQNSTYYGSQP